MSTDKIERSYIPLANEFDAYVITNGSVHYSRIVGVEINGEDTGNDRLVAIVNHDDGSIRSHRVETAFHHECYAVTELDRRNGVDIEGLIASALERNRQATAPAAAA